MLPKRLWKVAFLLIMAGAPRVLGENGSPVEEMAKTEFNFDIDQLYRSIFRDGNKPSYEAFAFGMEGYLKLLDKGKLDNKDVLTIIDYTRPSSERRLWVVDMKSCEVLFNTLVAHGKNSGELFATKFSNTPYTNMSSHGFFITGETYIGKHGYSLRIDGIEEKINDKASALNCK